MPTFAVWERGVLIFSALCHLALLWRLWQQKLARIYSLFFVFLVVDLLQNLLLLPIKAGTNAYWLAYVSSTPFIWLGAYLVVVELYRLILEDYPGVSSVGRKAVTWCLALAVLISTATAVPEFWSSETGKFVVLKLFYSVERSVILGLLVFLILIQLFLYRYRLPLSRNRLLYSSGYALYFGIGMAADIIQTRLLGVRVFRPFSLGVVVFAGLILLAGAFVLSREGEIRPTNDLADTSSERAHLQQQLAEMNRLLSRAARGS